ncbi:MAG: hypothetical protein ACFFBI_15505 [Promethearchaeota archaeon]
MTPYYTEGVRKNKYDKDWEEYDDEEEYVPYDEDEYELDEDYDMWDDDEESDEDL